MPYVISGRIIGLLCDDCSEPLVGATVRLVASAGDRISHAAAAEPKHTAAVLAESDAAGRASSGLGEGVVDPDGGFKIELGKDYDGGAFDVDIFCGTMTGHPVPPKPLSFTLTTLAPQWRKVDGGYAAAWSYEIPQRMWCGIRGRLGWWSICGHVRVCDTKIGVPGVKVSAFDVDWLQDDSLGNAVTDATGHFRIDYTVTDFTKTPWSPWINIELVAGPDVYFRIDGPTGVLLQEPRSRGRGQDRQNVGPCFCVDLCVQDSPGGTDQPYPWFDHIGTYKTVTGFDSAPGGPGAASPTTGPSTRPCASTASWAGSSTASPRSTGSNTMTVAAGSRCCPRRWSGCRSAPGSGSPAHSRPSRPGPSSFSAPTARTRSPSPRMPRDGSRSRRETA